MAHPKIHVEMDLTAGEFAELYSQLRWGEVHFLAKASRLRAPEGHSARGRATVLRRIIDKLPEES